MGLDTLQKKMEAYSPAPTAAKKRADFVSLSTASASYPKLGLQPASFRLRLVLANLCGLGY